MKSRTTILFAGALLLTLAFYLLAPSLLSPNPATETANSAKTGTITASAGTTNSTKRTTAVGTNQTGGGNPGEGLLSGSAIYSELGYPILTYDGNSRYSPGKPNFTLVYQSNPVFTVGSVEIPAINITQAARLAASYAGLSKANYSLVDADFEPGIIVNDTIKSPATWNLGFARVVNGYWLYGSADDNGATNVVSLNAISGSIVRSLGSPGAEPAPGNYTFRVNSSQALASVRGLNLLNLPSGFTANGNVTSIVPRIVRLGLSPHTFYLYAPANGQDRLCWNVSLSYHTSNDPYVWHATFYVDGQNGGLLAASAQDVFNPGPGAIVSASFVSSSARNLTVSQEAFRMNASTAGFPHPVTVEVPNVVVVRPGSIGGISINFSYDGPAYLVASLDFSILPTSAQIRPPVGLPPGVVVSFSDNAVAVNATTSTTRTIFFAAEGDAPPGTYLVKVSAVFPDNQGLFAQLPFLLMVWNGTGQWPPPPP